jgi:hypothetical protein
MELSLVLVAGTCALLATCVWRLLRRLEEQKAALEQRTMELALITGSLNCTREARARQVTLRSQSLRQILQDIPGLDPEPLICHLSEREPAESQPRAGVEKGWGAPLTGCN